jgi:hypothetical protein
VDLFGRLDRTGTRSDDYFGTADGDAAAQIDDGALGLELAAGEFEWLRDADNFAHTFKQLKIAVIEIAMHADSTENGVRSAGGPVHIEAAGDNAVDDHLNLLFGGAFVHDNDHG